MTDRRNMIVQYTTYLLPLVATFGAVLKLGRVPTWVIAFFLPGYACQVAFKLDGEYYSVEIPKPISSRLPWQKARRFRKAVLRVEDEMIAGIRLMSSLGSVVLASRGLHGLAVLMVCYGLVTAEFLNQSRMQRWRDEVVDQAAKETQDRASRRHRRKHGRQTSADDILR